MDVSHDADTHPGSEYLAHVLLPCRITKPDRFTPQNAATGNARKHSGRGPHPHATGAVGNRDHQNNHRQKNQQNDSQRYYCDTGHVSSLSCSAEGFFEFIV
jgi:hypothetical protein